MITFNLFTLHARLGRTRLVPVDPVIQMMIAVLIQSTSFSISYVYIDTHIHKNSCFTECEYEYEYEYLRGDVLVGYCEDVCDCTAIGRDQCTVTWYTCYLIEWTFQINENNSTGRIYDNSDRKHCRYSSATTCKNEYETRFAVNNQVQ